MGTPGQYYEGQTATNPQTGEQLVYRNRRWQSQNSSSATNQARTTLNQEQGKLRTMQQTAEYADEFLDHNGRRTTGGLRDAPWVPDWGDVHRQAMTGLSDAMVRANIQPGTASTMNSDAEARMARGQYPSTQVVGPVNQQRALELHVQRDTQQARISAMEHWVARHGSLDGFNDAWAVTEPVIRRQAMARNHPYIYRDWTAQPDANVAAARSAPNTDIQIDENGNIIR